MKKTVSLFFLFFITLSLFSTIASGTEPGSFFYSNLQYSSIPEDHRALFYSPDHGETIIRRYFYDDQFHKKVMSDASPGVVYLYNRDTFEVSFDFGATWEFVEVPGNNSRYSSGCLAGELYKWESGYLYRSTDYGYNYVLMSEMFWFGFLQAGSIEGEVYCFCDRVDDNSPDTFHIRHSNDFGETFNYYMLDQSIVESINLTYARLHKGTIEGELYLVGFGPPTHYEIYFSNDYGQSFELKYVGEEFDMAIEGYDFASGNEAGSFYMRYNLGDYLPDQTNLNVTFYHSTDYGETFTEEYYHYFDDTFENPNYLIAYPNNFEVNGEAGNLEFNIASNVNWSRESDSNWITAISPSTGYEDGTITVEYTENIYSPRTANITIQSEATEDEVVTIWQDTNVSAEESELNINNSKLKISNYPNPFYLSKSRRSNSTTICYDLPENVENHVIEIFNVKGQRIRELKINNSELKIGKTTWDGIDQHRNPVSSGVYLYRVKADDFVSKTARMLILK